MSRYVRLILFFVGWLLVRATASGQCPQPGFTLPDTVCMNESFNMVNTSTGATRYEWDFCSGDLEKQPVFSDFRSLSMMGTALDMDIVTDGNNWYGFVCSWGDNKLYRLNFGNNLNNVPSVTDLGNISGLLSLPIGITLVNEGGNWYGLVVNVLGNSSKNLIRLNFGNSPANVPAGTNISVVSPLLSNPRNLELVESDGQKIVFIPNSGNNRLVIVNFKNSLSTEPASSDVIEVDLAAGNPALWDITLTQECGKWYGLLAGYNNRLFRLNFDLNPFSRPQVNDLSTNIAGQGNPVKINLYREANANAFVYTQTGKLFRLGFGGSVSNNAPSLTIINTQGLLNDGQSLNFLRQGSEWVGFMINWHDKKLIRINFPNTCGASKSSPTQTDPDNLFYSSSGWHQIVLSAFNAQGWQINYSDSVYVRPAASADFSTDQQCEGAATRFRTSPPPAGNRIKSWNWTFSDGGTATGPDPSHVFANAGDYTATLTITDVCGKIIAKTQTVKIYQNTTPDFSGPLEFCSSQPQTFSDASTIAGDTPASYRWSFGNGITATGAQVNYSYPMPGKYTISLTVTGTSGCSASVSKDVTVKPGVNVNFSQVRACLGYETQFSDQSVVAEGIEVVSRTWNFGDNTTSNALNPVHRYAGAGSYPVTLTVVSSAGCTNTRTQTVTIRRLPQPAFSVSLACSGEQVAFTDESLSPEGSITGWQWTFDDPESGNQNISPERNPQHLFVKPSTYQVKLKVFTNFGCADSLTKAITVTQSPQSDFTYRTNCNSREVAFTDQSLAGDGNTITDWYWDFGDNGISTTANPVHTYGQPGSYTVTLITTSSTRCQNLVRKTVQVYRPPVADFTAPSLICTGVPVALADNSTLSAGDPVVQWQWQVGGETFTQSSATVTFAAGAGSLPVTLSVTTASGCQSSVTRQIAVRETPTVSFSYQASALQPLRVNFTGTTSGATGVTWDFGDGQTSDLTSPVHAYSSGGIYEVTLSARNAEGCQRVVTQTVTVTTVADSYELKLEGVSVITTGTSRSLQVKLLNRSTKTLSTLRFTVTPGGGALYEQDWTGSLLPGTLISYSMPLPPEAGASANGVVCVRASDQSTGTTSNRQCVSLSNTLSLLSPAPNPASGSFRLGFILPESGEVRVDMVDATGRMVAAPVNQRYPAGYSEKTQSVAHLARGLYFIRLTFSGQVQIKPLFVH